MKNLLWAVAFVTVAIFIFVSCKKSTASLWYTGLEVVDSNGKVTRWVGQQDNDWQQNKYTFTTQQRALLTLNTGNFPLWGNTYISSVAVYPGTDPIGLDTGQYIFYSFSAAADSDCAISYTVADEQMNVITQGNTFITGGSLIQIPVQIPRGYVKAGQVYRLYYGFSAQLKEYFSVGWGNFGVCDINVYTRRPNACF